MDSRIDELIRNAPEETKPMCMRELTESEMDEQIRLGLEDLEANGGLPFKEAFAEFLKLINEQKA
jgi:hypothetical protein